MTVGEDETSNSYALWEDFSGGQILSINEHQYGVLNESLTTVVSALEIEELFQVFAQSFLGFEKGMLEMTFEYAYSDLQDSGFDVFFDSIRHRFNVNILTILTCYKSYDDHCSRILKSVLKNPEAVAFNDETRSYIFDTNQSYRICAGLRDYAQHRALPLGGFSIGSKANFTRDAANKVVKLDTGFNVSAWLNVSKLASNPKRKPIFLAVLETLDCEKIDMKWLIRSFAGAMYERHTRMRDFFRPMVEFAGERIAEAYASVSTAKGAEAKFLKLCGGGEERSMREDLSAKVLASFDTLSFLKGAERSYVTSQIMPASNAYSGRFQK